MNTWSNGLFSCADAGTCIMGLCCANILMAQTRTAYDNSNCCFNFCCASPIVIQNIVREGYGIEGGCCGDIFVTSCCPACTAIRLAQEVKARGPSPNAFQR
mmetsp:Transcript_3924/g.6364  ORF Transcript_3924/g.6364 Transcript_3924/m.6364 type:complete len:101 (-) Transcript_3924:15-317(-)